MANIEQLALEFGDVVAVLEDWEEFVELAKNASSRHKYCWRVEGPDGSYLKAVIGGQFMVGFETTAQEKALDKKLTQLRALDFKVTRFVKLRAWATAVPS